jgi:predicted HTH domain antitoxin
MKPAGIQIDRLWFDAESVKGEIREAGGKVQSAPEKMMYLGDSVSPFFIGMNFGDASKIHEIRKELIAELSKNRYGERIWERVREFHSLVTIALVHERGSPSFEEAKRKLGVSQEDFEEILKARASFALPSFEKIKKEYGVA